MLQKKRRKSLIFDSVISFLSFFFEVWDIYYTTIDTFVWFKISLLSNFLRSIDSIIKKNAQNAFKDFNKTQQASANAQAQRTANTRHQINATILWMLTHFRILQLLEEHSQCENVLRQLTRCHFWIHFTYEAQIQ